MGDLSNAKAVERSCSLERFAGWVLVLLLGVGVLGGCTLVGPDFRRPSANVSEQWLDSEDPRLKAGPAPYSEWWKAFQDPVLEDLIHTAYRQNLSLRTAGVRVFESRAQLGIAVGNLFPQTQQLQGSMNYNRSSERSSSAPQTSYGAALGFSYDQVQAGFSAQWELDFWGRLRRGVESADATLLSSIAAYDNALVTLTGDVAKAYVQIRTLEERIRIARENMEIQRESLRIAEARFKGGATSERDVQQALTQLHATEATIPQLEKEWRQQLNALSVLMGLPPGHIEEKLAGPSAIPRAPIEIAVGMPAELLRRRPDIRNAEYQAAAQCAQIGVAKAELFPAFSLSGNFGFLSTDFGKFALGDVTSWRSRTGSIGPSFQWNLLNYGQITNNVRLQDAKFQELIVTYQNTVLQAQQEVEDGLVSFLKAQERVKSLTLAVEAAKRSVELSLIQYREGATDYTTVLTAEQALLTRQDDLAVGQGDVPQGMVSVYRAFGGGWELREGENFIPADTREAMEKRTNWGNLLKPAATAPPSSENRDAPFRAPDW